MKKSYKAVFCLVVVSFVIVGIFLTFMPDRVPMHYNAAGGIDRMGSKYEYLLIPLILAALAGLIVVLAKYQARRGESGTEKAAMVSGISVLAFMIVLEVYILWKAAAYSPNTGDGQAPELLRLTALGLGALFIIIGNIMPKAGRNSLFGLRTGWSMKNDDVWQRCQRFGGYSAVVFGVMMIICGIALSGLAAACALIGLTVVMLIADIAASYRIYKRWLSEADSGK